MTPPPYPQGTLCSNSAQTSVLVVFFIPMTGFIIHPGTQGPAFITTFSSSAIPNPKYEFCHPYYHTPNSIDLCLLLELTSLALPTQLTLKLILHPVARMNSLKKKTKNNNPDHDLLFLILNGFPLLLE